MCLWTRFDRKLKEKTLKKIDGEWIQVWKIVQHDGERHTWQASYMPGFYFHDGPNICQKSSVGRIECCDSRDEYAPYMHFWLDEPREYKQDIKRDGWKLIKCYIHKRDVSTIGMQNGKKCVVARGAIFPTFPRIFLLKSEKQEYGII